MVIRKLARQVICRFLRDLSLQAFSLATGESEARDMLIDIPQPPLRDKTSSSCALLLNSKYLPALNMLAMQVKMVDVQIILFSVVSEQV
jgi:hypothetical protein